MKFCEKCGSEIHEEAVICVKCGADTNNSGIKVTKDNDTMIAAIIQLLFGFGIGRFMLGDSKTGVLQLILTFVFGIGRIWCFIDGIMLLMGKDMMNNNNTNN